MRDGNRVRHETIANISRLPADAIEALTLALRGVRLLPAGEALRISRSLPHGHVEAVLAAARRLGLERLLEPAVTDATFDQLTEPTRLQAHALALINEHTPNTT